MMDFISIPMGLVLKFIYDNLAFQNYGIAIILLTVVVKSFLLPLIIKQAHYTSKISEIQPKMQEIQKLYSNDQEKQSTEIMKLYQENKLNPTGGCLPFFIQMPIVFSLYYVISQPLKYMVGKSPETIAKLCTLIPNGNGNMNTMNDLVIITYFKSHPDQLSQVSDLLKPEELLNMNFLGINLGNVPSWNPVNYAGIGADTHSYLLLLIPILSGLTSYISMKYSMKYSMKDVKNVNGSEIQTSVQNNLALFSPIMSAVIAFTVPAGLGLYWIIGNIYQLFQQLFIDIFILRKINVISEN